MASIKVYLKEDPEEKIIGTPSVKKEMSKQFLNPDTGETLYYIDRDYGMKIGLISKMDFRNTLDGWPDMCRINIKINRT